MPLVTLRMERIFTNKVVTLVTLSFERFLLGLIVSKFKRGGGWIELKKISHKFSLFTKHRKRIDLFWKEQIYFSAYFNKTTFKLYDFQILRELISKQSFTLICAQKKIRGLSQDTILEYKTTHLTELCQLTNLIFAKQCTSIITKLDTQISTSYSEQIQF